MSGGPIFNNDGHLCGLVCASMKGDIQDQNISYVVSIWPSLSTFIDIKYPENPSGSRLRVYDVARFGRITVVDFEQVFISQDEYGQATIGLKNY